MDGMDGMDGMEYNTKLSPHVPRMNMFMCRSAEDVEEEQRVTVVTSS